MKKKTFKSCIIFLISISSCFGCGGGYDWGTYGNLFGPEVLSDSVYANYFVQPPYCDYCNDQVQESNLLEWQRKFPQIKNLEFFREVLYTATVDQVEKLASGTNPFSNNTFAEHLIKPSLKYALDYIVFAKNCEPYTISLGDEEVSQQQLIQVSAQTKILATQALEKMNSIEDVFFKQRYYFQAVRMNFYGGYNDDCEDLVNKYNEELNLKGTIYYRILAYKAGAMKLLGRKAEADLIFARIFNESDALRNLAYINFLRLNNEDNSWDGVLSLAQSATDKASLWMLKNLYVNTVTLEALTNIYLNEPNSSKLELLAVKYLNDIESSIFIPYLEKSVPLDSLSLSYGEPSTWDQHGKVLKVEESWWLRFWKGLINFFRRIFGMKPISQLEKIPSNWLAQNGTYDSEVKPASESNTIVDYKNFLKQVTEDVTITNKSLYLSILAYLEIMTENSQEAQMLLDKAKSLNSKNGISLLNQIDYLTVLNETIYGTINEKLESQILKYLIKPLNPEDNYASYRRNLLLNELARRYLQKNDIVHAIYAFSYSNNDGLASALIDWYLTIDELDQFIEASSSPKTALEKYWLAGFYKKDELMELKAIKLTRMGMFEKAEPILSQLQAKNYFNSNKGNDEIENGVALLTSFERTPYPKRPADFQQFSHFQFNKDILTFIKLKEYEKVANGLYYSQYFNYSSVLWGGNLLFALNQTSFPGRYPFNVKPFATEFHNRKMSFVKQYCSQYLASTYYQKAFDQEKDQEIKAKYLYLTKQALEKSYVSYYEQGLSLESESIFETLQKHYASTKFYQEASINCAYLKDFLQKRAIN